MNRREEVSCIRSVTLASIFSDLSPFLIFSSPDINSCSTLYYFWEEVSCMRSTTLVSILLELFPFPHFWKAGDTCVPRNTQFSFVNKYPCRTPVDRRLKVHPQAADKLHVYKLNYSYLHVETGRNGMRRRMSPLLKFLVLLSLEYLFLSEGSTLYTLLVFCCVLFRL